MLRLLLLMTIALTSAACAHQVKVTSNVPDAHVRVDGERLGLVKDGVVFTERGGIGATYDIEVVADGYVTKRQIVKPSEIDPWVGIPVTCLAVGSCGVAGCAAPLFALYAATTEQGDTTGQVVGYGIAGGLVGAALGAIATASWGVERLPDEVRFDLIAVGEEPATPPAGTTIPVPVQSVTTPAVPTPEPAKEAPKPEAPNSPVPSTTPAPPSPNTPATPQPKPQPPKPTPAPTPKPPTSQRPVMRF